MSPKFGEVNPSVVRRRGLVNDIDSAVEDLLTRGLTLGPAEAEEEVATSLGHLMAGIQKLLQPASGANGVELVSRAISRLHLAVDALRSASVLRPSSRPRAFLNAALSLQRLWPLYREAFTTVDVSRVQRRALDAQIVIDETARHLDDLGADMEAVNELTAMGDAESFALKIFRGLCLRHPGLDMSALARLGTRAYSDVSGETAGNGASVDFLIIQLIARAYLDPDVMAQKFAEIATVKPPRTRVREVSKMRDALRDLSIARRDIFEALYQFHLIASSEADVAAVFRRLAKTAGELYEAALPVFVWTRLLLSDLAGPDSYARLAREDSTASASWLQKALPSTVTDLPKYLRHAGHHGRSFDVDMNRGMATIQLRSHSEQMTLDQYVDRIYALLESVLALQWSLANWLELSSVEIEMDAGLAVAVGLTPQVLVQLWLEEGLGVQVEKSMVVDRVWYIAADLSPDRVLSTACVAASQCGDGCDVVEVKCTSSSEATWHLNLMDYEKAVEGSTGGGLDGMMRLLRLRHAIVRDNACALRDSDLEFAIAVVGTSILNGELAHLSYLHELRLLAKFHGAAVAETIAVRTLRGLREGNEADLKREHADRLTRLTPPTLPTPASIRFYVRSNYVGPHSL